MGKIGFQMVQSSLVLGLVVRMAMTFSEVEAMTNITEAMTLVTMEAMINIMVGVVRPCECL
jgi:hypothetical protein